RRDDRDNRNQRDDRGGSRFKRRDDRDNRNQRDDRGGSRFKRSSEKNRSKKKFGKKPFKKSGYGKKRGRFLNQRKNFRD
ncbi:MAG: hypothetical protein ACJZ4O_04145, partial [Pelagibacteraceae bacterium]